MKKITKILNCYIDDNTHYLLQAFMEKHQMTISQSIRKMVECAIIDYNEDKPFYSFVNDIKGCYQKRLPNKVATGVSNEMFEELTRMKDEIGVSSVSTLFRRIIQTLIIDYWMNCYEGTEEQK
ncbi:MAG: hypothetical protein KQH59_01955 [Desulfobulbaceae bacterium]|nr:hypothetical protein [Desulfobulbaceae bacterium]